MKACLPLDGINKLVLNFVVAKFLCMKNVRNFRCQQEQDSSPTSLVSRFKKLGSDESSVVPCPYQTDHCHCPWAFSLVPKLLDNIVVVVQRSYAQQ